MDFLIFDGKIYAENELNLTKIYLGETFRITQKNWFGFGGIPLFNENIELLQKQISTIKLPAPKELENTRELFRITKRMLNKNKFYRSGLIHNTILWCENQTHSIITSEAFQTSGFPFRKEGIFITKSNLKKHSQLILNRFPFFCNNLWAIALNEISGTRFQNTLITNENDFLCECAFSNIFMIRGNTLITPSLNTGCYEDLLRNIILNIAGEIKLKVEEKDNFAVSDLLRMDEIFIAGEANGMQWILGLENKRFVHHFSTVIHRKLNDYLEGKAH